MGNRWLPLAVGLWLILFSPAWSADTGEKSPPPDRVFAMREFSVLSEHPTGQGDLQLTRGQAAFCESVPDKAIKAYPKLKSKRPFYGKIQFNSHPGSKTEIEFHFVLDESGEPAAGASSDKKKVENPEPSSLLKSLLAALGGQRESKPTEASNKPVLSSYDRLYVDLNRDLDLTNDRPLEPMKNPPWDVLPQWSAKEKQVFEPMTVDFDYGSGIGKRPLRIVPWLRIAEESGKTYASVFFVAATARRGTIQLGTRSYFAVLGQPYLVTGRFDRYCTGLSLTPANPLERMEYDSFDSDMLSTMRRVDGQLYQLSTTPTGDKLLAKPYRGDYGVLEIGVGGRRLKELSMRGSLRSETMAIGVGSYLTQNAKEKTPQVRVPVGDYLPSYLSIEFGRLQIGISDNYHADGLPRAMDRTRTYGFKIRKDKPFVLDFSNKPTILFASPARGQTVKPGDEVSVKAVLIDPVLDVMIRRLNDTKHTQKEIYKLAEGKEQSYERPISLDPIVTVSNGEGKTVATGKMPFG